MSNGPPDGGDILIGVSACLLGEEVRFNGGHKLDRFVKDTLGAWVKFVPVCPEVDIGLGVPRETLRLVSDDKAADGLVRLVTTKSGDDHTPAMTRYAKAKVKELGALELCGYVGQKGSPSCGMERVKVYPPTGGTPRKDGRGLFLAELMARFPNLPVEEEGRLNDAGLRENFVERVFAYRRLRTLFAGRWKARDLVAFHTREKLLVLAHDRPRYQELGRLVAGAGIGARKDVARDYETLFMQALKRMATPGKHSNVLQHAMGHLKKLLDNGDKGELLDAIDTYRRGYVPLVVPLTLLKHHVRRHEVDYLLQQSYLQPHPRELMLRNHV